MLGGTAQQTRVMVVERGPRLAAPALQQLVSELPPTECRRIQHLHRWQDRQDSAIGWRLLQQLAAGRGVTVRRGVNGRPGTDPPVDVSLSHSGGWIAVGLCGTGRIGVDVETLREVSPSLARRCLSTAELAWLDRAGPGEPRSLRFARLWTAKEAYLKATGVGLRTDPRDVGIDHTGDAPRLVGPASGSWRFSSSAPAPGVCVTVCVEGGAP